VRTSPGTMEGSSTLPLSDFSSSISLVSSLTEDMILDIKAASNMTMKWGLRLRSR